MGERGLRERIVRWHDPNVTADALRELSGLEVLRAMVRGELPSPPIMHLLGFTLTEANTTTRSVRCTVALH